MMRYAEAIVCVFPSHMETQGLVSLEAMLMGRPVVFTKYGPGPETIEHGKTGLLCDVYDPKDIAEKVMEYLEDIEMASRLGKNAREVVIAKYDKKMIIERNIEFYRSI
jgi:glycosyltransferase involved in cell wall biosynthesis